MRARKTTGLLVAFGAIVALMAPMSSQAGPNDGFIAQAGDSRGSEGPVISGFAVKDVLYDPAGFPIGNTPRGLWMKYVAYGTLTGGQVAVTSSTDGLSWAPPSGVVVRDQNNQDAPLIIGAAGRLAAAYVPGAILPHGMHFVLTYAPATAATTETTTDQVYGLLVNNIRYAVSPDGGVFYNDNRVSDDVATGSLTQPGTRTAKILGPVDLIAPGRRGGPTHCLNTTGTTPTAPFGCDFVLLYATQDDAGVETISIAGGIYFSDLGLQLKGMCTPTACAAPVITPSGWATDDVDRAHLAILNPAGCVNHATIVGQANASCQVEVDYTAKSSVGTGTYVGTARGIGTAFPYANDRAVPAVGPAILAALGASSAADLQRIASNPPRYYFTTGNDTRLAFPVSDPGAGPRITITKPTDQYRSANIAGIEFLLNDDFGANPGINLGSLSLSIDGGSVFGLGGVSWKPTIVNALTTPGWRISLADSQIQLADGEHTLDISIRDREGLVATKSLDFVIDLRAPSSLITRATNSGYSFPLNSLYAEGASTEAIPGSGLTSMRGVVRNPLGQSKTFEAGPNSGDVFAGFTFDDVAADGSSWSWRWAVPSSDALFYALPGTYVIEVYAVDAARNVEVMSNANRRAFNVL